MSIHDRPVSRRGFLAASGASLAGLAVSPALLARAASPGPATAAAPAGVIVAIYLRGGADGLSMVPPYADAHYAAARPTLSFAAPGLRSPRTCIDLDGRFGLAPALEPLLPAFRARRLLIAHATGLSTPTRSHTHARHLLEHGGGSSGSPWLAHYSGGSSGSPACFLDSLAESALAGCPHRRALKIQPSSTQSRDAFAAALGAVAQTMHEDPSVGAFALELDGWDTHADQGPFDGRMADLMSTLAQGLAAFDREAIVPSTRPVTVAVVSEFGRRVAENDQGGTEHGRAGVAFLLGNRVPGGRVLADWPTLAPGRLADGLDLPVTTDVHALLARTLPGPTAPARTA